MWFQQQGRSNDCIPLSSALQGASDRASWVGGRLNGRLSGRLSGHLSGSAVVPFADQGLKAK